MVYQIIELESLKKDLNKILSRVELSKYEKFKQKLKENPFLGDQLRKKSVREFKTRSGKRIYFIIYDDIKTILFVTYSNKKEQKFVINEIFKNLEEFEKFVYDL